MNKVDQAYDAWKDADAMARSMARKVARAWRLFDSGIGPPPPEEVLLEAWLSRGKANELLREAIAAMQALTPERFPPESRLAPKHPRELEGVTPDGPTVPGVLPGLRKSSHDEA